MAHHESEMRLSAAQRKQLLLAQGALYRLQLMEGKSAVAASLSTESIVQSAISHVGTAAFAAFKSRAGLSGPGLQAMAPLLLRGITILAAKNLLKPVLRGLLIAGTVAAIAGVVAIKKRSRASRSDDHQAAD